MTREARASIFIVLSFALLCATSLFVRQDGSEVSLTTHYISRAVEIGTCFFIAYLSRSKRLNVFRVFWVGVAVFAAYLAFDYVLPLVSFSDGSTLSQIFDGLAGLFNGVVLACFTLLIARSFCELPSKLAAVLIPLGWALSHILFLLSSFVPSGTSMLLKAIMLVLSVGMLWFVLRLLFPSMTSGNPVDVRKKKLSFFSILKQSRYFTLYFGMLVFPFFYGLMAQICSDAGISSGLFDVSSEIVGIVFLLILAASEPLWKKKLDAESMFVVLLPLFATALLFLPLFWSREVFVSGFIVKCGFLIYTSLMWVYLQRTTNQSSDDGFFFFGIAIGLYHLALMAGRFFAFALGLYTDLSDQAIAGASLAAIWLLSMAALIMLVAKRRKPEQGKVSGGNGDFDEQCERFAKTYRLSERELTVLKAYARGRSVGYIANELVVSQETVKTHLKRLYAKSECHNRQDLLDKIEDRPNASDD